MYKPIPVIFRETIQRTCWNLVVTCLFFPSLQLETCTPTDRSHQSSTKYSQTAHSEHICVRLTTHDFSVFPVVGREMVVIVHKGSSQGIKIQIMGERTVGRYSE